MAKKSKNPQEKSMERADTLQKYVSDMIAVEEHIGSAVKRQVKDDSVAKHTPQAGQLIREIADMTERHEEALKQHLTYLGSDPAKGIKEVATAVLGSLAGIYDKVRTEPVSKMLRDDYTALNLATMGYTMLHTTGLALNDQPTADLALRHLREYTKIVMEINQVIPGVVVTDLRNDGGVINDSALQSAIANTQSAWQPSDSQSNVHLGNGNGASAAKTKGSKKASKSASNGSGPSTSELSVASPESSAIVSDASVTTSKPKGSKSKSSSSDESSATPKKRTSTSKSASSKSKTPSV